MPKNKAVNANANLKLYGLIPNAVKYKTCATANEKTPNRKYLFINLN